MHNFRRRRSLIGSKWRSFGFTTNVIMLSLAWSLRKLHSFCKWRWWFKSKMRFSRCLSSAPFLLHSPEWIIIDARVRLTGDNALSPSLSSGLLSIVPFALSVLFPVECLTDYAHNRCCCCWCCQRSKHNVTTFPLADSRTTTWLLLSLYMCICLVFFLMETNTNMCYPFSRVTEICVVASSYSLLLLPVTFSASTSRRCCDKHCGKFASLISHLATTNVCEFVCHY